MTMLRRTYELTFVAPAFLGNAEQVGQWRTPPVKALVRQWWRVAYSAAQHHRVRVDEMRRAEAELFGTVEGQAHRSLVRVRLSQWSEGRLKSWNGLEQQAVPHPEVQQTRGQVGPHVYLAYGPLTVENGQTTMKRTAAIQAGESAILSLAWPDAEVARQCDAALDLLGAFGTLGGRSRNGWGSFGLKPMGGGEVASNLLLPFRGWIEALATDWPHAIGSDDSGPLIWATSPCNDWRAAMRRLAELKIKMRTMFGFTTSDMCAAPEQRHWLSYPVTRHKVAAWERPQSLRLPSTLRFKLRPAADSTVVGVVFHMPCSPPRAFNPDPETLKRVWRQVHTFLDDRANGLQRIPA